MAYKFKPIRRAKKRSKLMSILSAAARPKVEPLIVTICGTPGTGKTSLATTFPGPVFLIQTQGEKVPRDLPGEHVPVSIGETDNVKSLWNQLLALTTEEHPYKTVIIDSVTGLEGLFADEVLKSDPKAKSVQTAMGGYGAGRDAIAVMHGRVRKAAEIMRRRGINVVFIAHSDVATISPPDGDSYTQYSLRLHSKSMAHYVDSVDIVGFVKQATAVIGKEGEHKRAVSTGQRVLVTYLTPTAITKNRVGIDQDIPIERGVNPLAAWMPGQPEQAAPAQVSAQVSALEPAIETNETAEEATAEEETAS
jgi:phage nucleotide-binding protein